MSPEDYFHLGVKGLLFNGSGKILLLYLGGKGWDLPGGRIHKGESPEEALRREVREETGLCATSFDPLAMELSSWRIPVPGGDVGLVLSVYVCEAAGEIALSEEHVDFGWFSAEEATERLRGVFPEFLISKIASYSKIKVSSELKQCTPP